MSVTFGGVRQIAYLVDDIEAAMDHWVRRVGVGPFYYLARVQPTDLTYMGALSDPILSFGLAHSGTVQIELVQQHNEALSVFFDPVSPVPMGQHHLAFWTRTFDADMEAHLSRGHSVVQELGTEGARNAFLARDPGSDLLLEISEVSGAKGDFFDLVARACNSWDGAKPIRRVSAMRPDAIEEG